MSHNFGNVLVFNQTELIELNRSTKFDKVRLVTSGNLDIHLFASNRGLKFDIHELRSPIA